MAKDSQDVGLGEDIVFAGDTLRITFTVTTGGTSAGVTAAAYTLSDISPLEGTPQIEATKTLASGVTLSGGSVSGTVDVAVVLQPADTAGLSGDYYHELELTASGDENHVARGTLRLQPPLS